jgi:hypothetical protein
MAAVDSRGGVQKVASPQVEAIVVFALAGLGLTREVMLLRNRWPILACAGCIRWSRDLNRGVHSFGLLLKNFILRT